MAVYQARGSPSVREGRRDRQEGGTRAQGSDRVVSALSVEPCVVRSLVFPVCDVTTVTGRQEFSHSAMERFISTVDLYYYFSSLWFTCIILLQDNDNTSIYILAMGFILHVKINSSFSRCLVKKCSSHVKINLFTRLYLCA